MKKILIGFIISLFFIFNVNSYDNCSKGLLDGYNSLIKLYEQNISNELDKIEYIKKYENYDVNGETNAYLSSLNVDVSTIPYQQLINIHSIFGKKGIEFQKEKQQKINDLEISIANLKIEIENLKVEIENCSSNLNEINNTILCGKDSINDGNGKCICQIGYEWEDINDNKNLDCKKIDISENCKKLYGINSYYNSGLCYCNEGFNWNDNKTTCVKELNEAEKKLNQNTEIVFEKLKIKLNKYSNINKIEKYKNLLKQLDLYKSKIKSGDKLIIIEHLIFLINNELKNLTFQ